MNYDASIDSNMCEECITPTADSSCCGDAVTTPTRNRSTSPLVCPGAPRRRRVATTATEMGLPRILIPTLDTHRGRGILAADFIKPDPTATAAERRAHILRELQNWLITSMRIQTHAREVEFNCLSNLADEVATGTWPAARLCLIASRGNFDRIHDPAERYHSAATWAYWVCYNYLTEGTQPTSSTEELALGFVTTDRFADGATIEDLWNWSPTHPLRNAPPLPDSDAEDEAEETDTDIEDTVCFQRVRIEAPAWMWFAAFVGSIVYIWLVAYLVGSVSR